MPKLKLFGVKFNVSADDLAFPLFLSAFWFLIAFIITCIVFSQFQTGGTKGSTGSEDALLDEDFEITLLFGALCYGGIAFVDSTICYFASQIPLFDDSADHIVVPLLYIRLPLFLISVWVTFESGYLLQYTADVEVSHSWPIFFVTNAIVLFLQVFAWLVVSPITYRCFRCCLGCYRRYNCCSNNVFLRCGHPTVNSQDHQRERGTYRQSYLSSRGEMPTSAIFSFVKDELKRLEIPLRLLDLSGTDLLAGIRLVANDQCMSAVKQHSDEEGKANNQVIDLKSKSNKYYWSSLRSTRPFDVNEKRDVKMLRDFYWCMRYSLGAYGYLLREYMDLDISNLGSLCCAVCCPFGKNNIHKRKEYDGKDACKQDSVSSNKSDNTGGKSIEELDLGAILFHTKLKKKDIICYNSVFETSITQRHWYLAVDHKKKCVIVAIRGTLSLTDAMTDICYVHPQLKDVNADVYQPLDEIGKEFNFPGDGEGAHAGMLQSALSIIDMLSESGVLHRIKVLKERKEEGHKRMDQHNRKSKLDGNNQSYRSKTLSLLPEFEWDSVQIKNDSVQNEYQLIVTGHSLGAGVAAFVALLLKHRYQSTRCIAFSMPAGVMTEKLSKWCESFISSVFVGVDIIARLSHFSLEKLRNEIVMAGLNSNTSKWRLMIERLGCLSRAHALNLPNRMEEEERKPDSITSVINPLPNINLSVNLEEGKLNLDEIEKKFESLSPQSKRKKTEIYLRSCENQRMQRKSVLMCPPGRILHLATFHELGKSNSHGMVYGLCSEAGCCCTTSVLCCLNKIPEHILVEGDEKNVNTKAIEYSNQWYHGRVTQQGVRKLKPLWVENKKETARIVLGSRVLFDHFPDVVAAAIERVMIMNQITEEEEEGKEVKINT
eukprot:g2039.t1